MNPTADKIVQYQNPQPHNLINLHGKREQLQCLLELRGESAFLITFMGDLIDPMFNFILLVLKQPAVRTNLHREQEDLKS